MNRQEIIEKLRSFPYDPKEWWVITGAAMVIYGIREKTHDIDMGCSSALADRLEKDGFLYRHTESGRRWFKYDEDIEIFEDWLMDTTEAVEGFRIITVKGLVEIKEKLGRPKDFRDIELIREYLSEKGSAQKGAAGK